MPKIKLNTDKRQSDLDELAASFVKSFGQGAAKRGGLQKSLKSVPTGSLALDYELGIGGWPLGKLVGVFGPRDIGKSSMIGLSAVKNAQAMGLNCAWIALEPISEEWAVKNGVNIDDLLVVYPTTGEEAFAMLHRLIKSEVVDFIIFDSIGAILGEGEMDDDGKPRMGGQAQLITWGVKAAAPIAYKNDVGVILLNQVRHDMRPGVRGVQYKQPGGEALEHSEAIIVQLKRGKERYTIKEAGTDVQIGNEVICHILRNKECEGSGQKAIFDYFYKETADYPFGIDTFNDVINTAKRTGVIKLAGSYYDLPNGKRIQGLKSVIEYLQENADVFEQVREGVLEAMLERNARTVLHAVEEDVA